MIDDEVPEADPITQLERQLERSSLFTHTALSRNAEGTNELASLTLGLIDVLVSKGTVTEEELVGSAKAVAEERVERGEALTPGVALRVDAPVEADDATVLVDCEKRIPVCKAICCKLWFALTAEEVEAGKVRWDLGIPYHIRQEPNGFCTHLADEPRGCGVYEDRPGICRRYSCADDERIRSDFDNMELNEAWLGEHLGGTAVRLVGSRMMPEVDDDAT